MIVDGILDRRDCGVKYNPVDFYFYVMQYGEVGWGIARAMDGGTNKDVQDELCHYILNGDYNPEICDYIRSQEWI